MSFSALNHASPWFPNSEQSDVPSIISSRSTTPLFYRRSIRDADDFQLPEETQFDPLELQDDSFINFSVGNLDRRNFSMLGVTRATRLSTAKSAPQRSSSSEDDSTESGRAFRIPSRRRSKKRRRGAAQTLLSPVKRCFF